MANNKENPIKDKMQGIPGAGSNNNNKKNKYNTFLVPFLIITAIISMLFLNNGRSPIKTDW